MKLKRKKKTVKSLIQQLQEGILSKDKFDSIIDNYQQGVATQEEIDFLVALNEKSEEEEKEEELNIPYEIPKRSLGAAVLYTHRWESNTKIMKTEDGVFFKKKKPGIKFVYPKNTVRTKKVHLNQFETETLALWIKLEQSDAWLVNVQTKQHADLEDLLSYIYDPEDKDEDETQDVADFVVDKIG